MIYCDCLGGGRYIPGSAPGKPSGASQSQTTGVSDPFTGGGRYIPSYNDQASQPKQPPQTSDPLTGMMII